MITVRPNKREEREDELQKRQRGDSDHRISSLSSIGATANGIDTKHHTHLSPLSSARGHLKLIIPSASIIGTSSPLQSPTQPNKVSTSGTQIISPLQGKAHTLLSSPPGAPSPQELSSPGARGSILQLANAFSAPLPSLTLPQWHADSNAESEFVAATQSTAAPLSPSIIAVRAVKLQPPSFGRPQNTPSPGPRLLASAGLGPCSPSSPGASPSSLMHLSGVRPSPLHSPSSSRQQPQPHSVSIGAGMTSPNSPICSSSSSATPNSARCSERNSRLAAESMAASWAQAGVTVVKPHSSDHLPDDWDERERGTKGSPSTLRAASRQAQGQIPLVLTYPYVGSSSFAQSKGVTQQGATDTGRSGGTGTSGSLNQGQSRAIQKHGPQGQRQEQKQGQQVGLWNSSISGMMGARPMASSLVSPTSMVKASSFKEQGSANPLLGGQGSPRQSSLTSPVSISNSQQQQQQPTSAARPVAPVGKYRVRSGSEQDLLV